MKKTRNVIFAYAELSELIRRASKVGTLHRPAHISGLAESTLAKIALPLVHFLRRLAQAEIDWTTHNTPLLYEWDRPGRRHRRDLLPISLSQITTQAGQRLSCVLLLKCSPVRTAPTSFVLKTEAGIEVLTVFLWFPAFFQNSEKKPRKVGSLITLLSCL